ncbi:MAG TPA: cytochrome P450 [Dehalococcoidia bacterium]|nr:cytochrome P450 [Dehalococcoidia bacterium]
MVTVMEYDPFAADVKEDPYPYYAWLRREAPVYHNEARDIWALSRYRDISAALRNHTVFSSAQGVGPERVTVPMMITKDPPDHTRLRSLVNRAFTPRMIAQMEDRIRQIIRHLLEAALDRGSFDLVQDVAEPLPVIVIAEMLGVEPAQRPAFKRWSDDTIGVLGGSPDFDINQYLRTWQEFKAYFLEKIEERRAEPKDDLITRLVTEQEEGAGLTQSEILNFNLLLLVAGNETTTNLITNGALALLEHRDEGLKLRERPDLIPSAVEECLRYDSPIQASFRTTTQDFEIDGVTIPGDSKVMLIYGSANRDEEVFEEPDRFNVERDPNNHIAFAVGIHYCLGAPLARLEARLALEEVLAHMRDIRIDESVKPVRVDNPLFRGLKELKLLFDRP